MSLSCVGSGWYLRTDILVLYTTTALIMARAARTHPVMKTRFRFRTEGKRGSVSSWTPVAAALTPTSALLTWELAALCRPPQTEGTLGDEVPRALGHSLSLPTWGEPVRVEASMWAPGVGVSSFTHHDLTADVHLRGDTNVSDLWSCWTVPALQKSPCH